MPTGYSLRLEKGGEQKGEEKDERGGALTNPDPGDGALCRGLLFGRGGDGLAHFVLLPFGKGLVGASLLRGLDLGGVPCQWCLVEEMVDLSCGPACFVL